MGKNEKTGLGRALVKQHNQMIQESKEKGRFYKNQHKKVLESVTEVTDIDAIIEQAEEADRLFSLNSFEPNVPIALDASSSTSDLTSEERRERQKKEEELNAGSLRVPRRPQWYAGMSVEELDANERQAFLMWRRSLARLEENENLVLTPFEKNLDIWRQLWRVLERSDLLVMVVDARNPLFYRCPDLELYAREIDNHKRTLLLVNKADLLPYSVREKWAKYFHLHQILFVFWSAKAATAALEGKKLSAPQNLQELDNPDTKVYGRDELLARLQSEAEQIAKIRRNAVSSSASPTDANSHSGSVYGSSTSNNVVVGFVGYPNVGKSSTINALVGQKRTGVTSTPGKTKHFQTLIISDELTLCDCPGLVFPSFTSSRYEMIASGVLPIDRMTEHREAVQVVANRVPRQVIENVYKINLPKPKPYEPQSRPPLALELLRTYCASRGYVASSGLPDETRAARQILKDYIDGKLPHYQMPPGMTDEEDSVGTSLVDVHESDSSEPEDAPTNQDESTPNLDHVLDDLNSFDMAHGLASKKVAPKKPSALHKQHKKPQRKKDRSWRVGHGDDDGMPVVRVFQKPVNTGSLKI
ncbi:Circularly permuted (CP)-type guanine nucleotide-binding (G) protein [Trema orientale]|uniref:Circularly permuted (CP)-type guanine nucleotide-binding (G) protein n=1 Tax=Trema orientale TaxID=63057 RepID=A0A2P5FUA7_TREOI|nr:Circularly permuted (CP)-type guanine nucleotide-binding (G) protein [Trema orientale]